MRAKLCIATVTELVLIDVTRDSSPDDDRTFLPVLPPSLNYARSGELPVLFTFQERQHRARVLPNNLEIEYKQRMILHYFDIFFNPT